MLAGLKEVLQYAEKNKVAIGAFNTPDFASLSAVIDAAEKLDAPVIIMHAECHEDVAPLDKIAPCMVAVAKNSKVPVCVHLDHGEDFDYCKRAIAFGFTSIMVDCSALSFEENVQKTAEVVEYAHAHGVDVEAELGTLPEREGKAKVKVKYALQDPKGMYTDPKLAKEFVAKTKVDALAIAFGTVHGLYKVKPVLNTEIITAVKNEVDVPLVMHGGSGMSLDEYKDVISRGITKINYYTYMAYAGFAAAKKMMETDDADFFHNVIAEVKVAMEDNVEKMMRIFLNKENG